MISTKKIFFLLAFVIFSIFFWDSIIFYPIKILVVYLHEISHAVAALLTGGKVHSISVSWDESGTAFIKEGNFLVTALAGYIGSIIFGALMLYSALSGRILRLSSIIIGSLVLFFTLFFLDRLSSSIMYFGFIVWGIIFIIFPSIHVYTARLILFVLGSMSSMYSIYDLKDFFYGNILSTDAGLITVRYFKDPTLQQVFAYALAVSISILGVGILYYFVYHALYDKKETESGVPLSESGVSSETIILDEPNEISEADIWEEFKEWQHFKNIRSL